MLRSITLLVLIFLSGFLFASPTFADNLLLNSSFEDAPGGTLSSWTKNVSTATLGVATSVKEGTQSASINKTNSSTGTIYLYQDVDIEPESYYSLSGYALKNSANFSYALLRISWRNTSEISQTDSSKMTSDSTDFQQLSISSVQAPSSATKARIELLANISTVNPANPVLFDSINFSQIQAPEQPVASPVNSPTPSPSLSPTPVISKSPSPRPSPTPSASLLLQASSSSDEATAEMVLGVNTSSDEATLENTNTPATTSGTIEAGLFGVSPLFLGLTGIGTLFLSASGYMFFKGRNSGKIDPDVEVD